MSDMVIGRLMVVAGVLLTSLTVNAQNESIAEALFRQGRQAMRDGKPDQACPKFAESYRLDPGLGSLLNLGLCEERLGHFATAWSKLRQLVDAAPASDERVAIALQRLREIEAKLSYLQISLGENMPKDSVVKLDGVLLGSGSLGVPLPVDPGEHFIDVSSSMGPNIAELIQVAVAERVQHKLQLAPRTPAAVRSREKPILSAPGGRVASRRNSHDPKPADTNSVRDAAYVAGAIGATSLLTAAVFGAMALQQKAIVRKECRGALCTNAGADATESGKRWTSLADVALAVGATGVVTFGILLWQTPERHLSLGIQSGGAALEFSGELPAAL